MINRLKEFVRYLFSKTLKDGEPNFYQIVDQITVYNDFNLSIISNRIQNTTTICTLLDNIKSRADYDSRILYVINEYIPTEDVHEKIIKNPVHIKRIRNTLLLK